MDSKKDMEAQLREENTKLREDNIKLFAECLRLKKIVNHYQLYGPNKQP